MVVVVAVAGIVVLIAATSAIVAFKGTFREHNYAKVLHIQ